MVGAGSLVSCAVSAMAPSVLRASQVLRVGLTPVFLTNDIELLTKLKSYLDRRTGLDIELVQRRTYQEITSLLVSEQLHAAWICGYPFVAFREQLGLVAVPVWQGRPLYGAYVIAAADRDVSSIAQLEGDIHAFSDPDSNSGYLVTRATLASISRRPDDFFRRAMFTWGHRNVVRAVGSGLAMSGSVDGYVYDVLAEVEPALTSRTRVVRRSELMGFPPFACPQSGANSIGIGKLREALLSMPQDDEGRDVLHMLRLDGFVAGEPQLFDGVAELLKRVRSFG